MQSWLTNGRLGHYDNAYKDFACNDFTCNDFTCNDFTCNDFTYNIIKCSTAYTLYLLLEDVINK
jgi:hypothetical protein